MNNIDMTMFPKSFHGIVEKLGLPLAIELCETFGGEQIYIPKMDGLSRDMRNENIIQLHTSGCSFSQIAAKYNITVGSVRRIVRIYKKAKSE